MFPKDLEMTDFTIIVKALNLGSGHHYKCPNGHLYFIGDCGMI